MSLRTEHCTCDRCSEELVDGQVWRDLPKAERQALRAAGKARAARRNLCTRCYAWLRSRGELGRYALTTTRGAEERGARCIRCGHPDVVQVNLCRDCADVTYDLAEQAEWSA